jgi:hypothetical protein
MSTKIFESQALTVTSYAGPARQDDGPRMRLQIDGYQHPGDPTRTFPHNTLSFEEARRLSRALLRFIGEDVHPNTGYPDIDSPGHIELGQQLLVNVIERGIGKVHTEVEANITRMPDDPGSPDIMLVRATSDHVGGAKRELAKQLREFARAIDGLPIVTSIEVRNEPASWEEPQDGGAVMLERIKVMVELEHEKRVSHVVFEEVVEPMNMQISYGANAYHFAKLRIDPVSERWRQEREAHDRYDDEGSGTDVI